jgi:4-hydroxy-tetrahydrodipicolinate synthase|tara:strand:- start:80 stop:976 length:897 start_codon:yes stop_codon:yes gene_type:complete
MGKFSGSFTVMVTPFSEDGSKVDHSTLRRFVDWQISNGVPGLIPLGSTGEFLSIADEERREIVTTIIQQVDGRVPVLVGTADEWTDKAVRYSREAEELGASGVMVVPPYYASPTEDELYAHYQRISDAISIPIMVYNNPNTANVDLTPDLLARLSQIENVDYVKESSGDISRIREIDRLSEGRMTVFAGYHAFDSFLLGAKGYVSVCGNIVPKLSSDLYKLVIEESDAASGRELYHRLLPLLDAISGDLYVSATKAALELVGMPVGIPRMPRLRVPESHQIKIEEVLRELGVLVSKAA